MCHQGVHQRIHHSMLSLAIAAILAVPSAHAQEPAGSVIVRDPVTGEMRAPTAAELRALRATPAPGTANAGPQSPQPVVRPDGTRVVRLGEAGMVYSVATRGPDGKLQDVCVSGADAAERAVTAPVRPNKERSHEHR